MERIKLWLTDAAQALIILAMFGAASAGLWGFIGRLQEVLKG